MNVLMTLLAFAAVMVVFSTIVTVAVEALHKLLRFRRAGMEEMLQTLHDDAIAPRIARLRGEPVEVSAAPTKVSPEAKRFAREVMDNQAFGGKGRWWWLRNLPPFNWIFQRRFERLTTVQFAEQIARTDAGRQLATLDRQSLGANLSAIAYEFERYGDAQSDYFKRRAKVLAVVVGLVVAASLNLDAVTLFRSLYSDPGQSAQIAALLDEQRLNTLVSSTEATAQRIAAADVSAATAESVESAAQQVQGAAAQIKAAAAALDTSGLAYGDALFPYCSPGVGEPVTDPRCEGPVAGVWTPQTRAALQARLLSDPGETAVWLLAIAGTGGLLGLGAPFWFNLFRRLGSMAPAARAVQLVRSDLADDDAGGRAPPAPPTLRKTDNCSRDDLVRAFTIASGGADGSTPKRAGGPAGAMGLGAAGPGASEEIAEERGSALTVSRWLR